MCIMIKNLKQLQNKVFEIMSFSLFTELNTFIYMINIFFLGDILKTVLKK